jgi:membrane fusion protein (multidrug efflux system)
MRKRMILMLAVVSVVLTGLGTLKYFQVQAAIAQYSSYQPPPESVTTVVAGRERWDATLSAIGTVTAVHGVTVSADLPGLVERIAFESGRTVREGDVLVRLDTRQEQAQLAAADAQRELAHLQLERMEGLRAKGVTSQAELDSARASFTQAEARVGEIRATIARKTIRAPFTGVLGIRQVDLGQYLTGGDPVVSLQSLHPIYVDFAVPQQQVARVGAGTEVRVAAEGGPEGGVTAAGRVSAVDSVVDEATRNVRVQALFDNPEGRLKPGMFVETRVVLGPGSPLVALPASAIHYAPYGDSVFIVEEMQGPNGEPYRGVRQQFVELGGGRGDQVAVLSGVEPGEEVVTSGVFKLRQGAAVMVDNAVQPGNDPTPRPENS